MAQQPRVNPELPLTLCPRAQRVSLKRVGFTQGPVFWARRRGGRAGWRGFLPCRWGCSPDSSTPQRLRVLSATRSDCLGVVHLRCVPAPSPCIRRFSLGTRAEAIVPHSLILPPALCPAAFRLNAGKPQAPLGHPGTPATPARAPPPPRCQSWRREPAVPAATTRWSPAGTASGTGGLTSEGCYEQAGCRVL